jgi:nicotinate dehydrogenase subunit A
MADPIETEINGEKVVIDVPPTTPLLYVLRNDLGLTGSRHGCTTGYCGACKIMIDGRPIAACSIQVEAIAGRKVETIEAIEKSETGRLLLDAVLDIQAGQCGYCLPGMLMEARVILRRHPDYSRDEVAAALDGHICRCGSHNRIIDAIVQASKKLNAGTAKGGPA